MSLHVVLVGPEIPWNTGNVGRTCLATGAELHLVRPLGFSLDERRVRRAGLDYWEYVRPTVWPSWPALAPKLEEMGRPWFFSAEGDSELWQLDLGPDSVLVFGGETTGLPTEIREIHRDRLVRLPMPGRGDGVVRSLNLSTAVAVAIYEGLRQRSRG
ncbi:MAG: tRNA (cytidine(34)-2'-O)-methyltransferase [Thermoanaerobaculia bacterium]|nr:tRNA (cytidine(34)-2'-O)-methyltransferase [Thermoanaerobaculia bacterium]